MVSWDSLRLIGAGFNSCNLHTFFKRSCRSKNCLVSVHLKDVFNTHSLKTKKNLLSLREVLGLTPARGWTYFLLWDFWVYYSVHLWSAWNNNVRNLKLCLCGDLGSYFSSNMTVTFICSLIKINWENCHCIKMCRSYESLMLKFLFVDLFSCRFPESHLSDTESWPDLV